jgi:hypothetical protein
MKYILRIIARLNHWLAKKYIPPDTQYCYKYTSKGNIRCPYLGRRKDPVSDEDGKPFYWQYCHYTQNDLDIQDSCKDCLVNMDEDFYRE